MNAGTMAVSRSGRRGPIAGIWAVVSAGTLEYTGWTAVSD